MFKFLCVLASLLLFPALCLADGKAFSRSIDSTSFMRIQEHDQHAFIEHRNGRQSMLITINIQLDEKSPGFWLFPVRGEPADIKLDLADKVPVYYGQAPTAQARERVNSLALVARATQIWPILPELIFTPSLGRARSLENKASATDAVHKWGLRAEKVRAPSVDALADLLKERGHPVPAEQLKSFGTYLDGKHTLIAVTIESAEKVVAEFGDKKLKLLSERWPRVQVEFPSANVFYPMRASHHDAPERMPVTLQLAEWHMPVGGQLPYAGDVDYFDGSMFIIGETQNRQPLRYTRVRLRPAANVLTQDLEFVPGTPPPVARAAALVKFTAENRWLSVLSFFGLVLLLSWTAGAATSLLLTGKLQPGLWVATFNIFSLIGVYFALKYRPIRWFLPCFTIIFVVLVTVLQFALAKLF